MATGIEYIQLLGSLDFRRCDLNGEGRMSSGIGSGIMISFNGVLVRRSW